MPTGLLEQIQQDNTFKTLSPKGKRLFVGEILDRDTDFASLPEQHKAKFRNEIQSRFPDYQPETFVNNDPLGDPAVTGERGRTQTPKESLNSFKQFGFDTRLNNQVKELTGELGITRESAKKYAC